MDPADVDAECAGGRRVGGGSPTLVYPKPGHEPANYTVLNFPVDDIDAAVERVTRGGGQVVNGPMEVPGGISTCLSMIAFRIRQWRPMFTFFFIERTFTVNLRPRSAPRRFKTQASAEVPLRCIPSTR